MPGVPRIMYMEFPFHIFQARDHIAITFEWSQVFRVIYTNGTAGPDGISFWMGDSRGRWEGDTLVVDVTDHNDRTWFDMAGNFHSDAMHLVERYTMADADTIRYEVTVEDPKVFTKPGRCRCCSTAGRTSTGSSSTSATPKWRRQTAHSSQTRRPGIRVPRKESSRRPIRRRQAPSAPQAKPPASTPKSAIHRMPDGKPDLQGYYMPDGGGANYGLETHDTDFLTPGGRGIVVDPPDGKLAHAAVGDRGAREPEASRARLRRSDGSLLRRGRATIDVHSRAAADRADAGYVVVLHERMSYRIIELDRREHIPDSIRLWQGDALGRWEGDTLVVETTNLNGKSWLNEVGEIVSHAERVVERFTPVDGDTIEYQATVTDPIAYTRPWTIAFPINRQKDELLEVACHEDNRDLAHLKDIRDAARAAAKKRK